MKREGSKRSTLQQGLKPNKSCFDYSNSSNEYLLASTAGYSDQIQLGYLALLTVIFHDWGSIAEQTKTQENSEKYI